MSVTGEEWVGIYLPPGVPTTWMPIPQVYLPSLEGTWYQRYLPLPVHRQTPVKTLLSHNFVGCGKVMCNMALVDPVAGEVHRDRGRLVL